MNFSIIEGNSTLETNEECTSSFGVNFVSNSHLWLNNMSRRRINFYIIIGIITMFFMGCETTWRNLWVNVKNPVFFFIVLLNKTMLVPLTGYFILMSKDLEKATTDHFYSSVESMTCVVSYFTKQDASMSVLMAGISTLVTPLTIPSQIGLSGRAFTAEDFKIMRWRWALSTVSIAAPVLGGMAVRWKEPQLAKLMTKVGIYFIIPTIFISIILEFFHQWRCLLSIHWSIWGLLPLPLFGYFIGFLLSAVLNQNKEVQRTVAIECGFLNVPLLIWIMSSSISLEDTEDLSMLNWLANFLFVLVSCFVYASVQLCRKYFFRNSLQEGGGIHLNDVEQNNQSADTADQQQGTANSFDPPKDD